MIYFNGINTTSNIYFKQKASNVKTYPKHTKSKDSSIGNKITIEEGYGLILQGIKNQGKELISSIINHPLKTAALVSGTTLAMMALPFIGIPTAVGGGILAIGFAGFSLGKTFIHTYEFIKNNKQGKYHLARTNLEKLGEDTFDTVLSVPFAPKAITTLKNFSKFGKINFNSELILQLKQTNKLSEKFSLFKYTDKELSRSLNFQSAVENELAKLKHLSEAEKTNLHKELLDFNVTIEKLPEVVLDKWAKIRGIKTQPDIKYTSLPKNTKAIACASDCSIVLNNYKLKIPNEFSNYELISYIADNDNYIMKYKDTKNGKVIIETINKNIFDSYNKLCEIHNKLSPQASKILTLIHEREHIHQFAQMTQTRGLDWLKNNITQRSKYLFNKMIDEMKQKIYTGNEYKRINSYFEVPKFDTPASYIKKPIEIDARASEYKAIKNSVFQTLDKIFKKINSSNNISIEKNILINDARIESAA
uniref:Uncharacterized protein n=1 Tax=uncultured Candidatus Melainabacteria bacterium TaxID=2682970 RepID=A0A650ELA1_9BACT|nr:hypothetical protein Melaina855_1110 [uncultured Candidatus Melainabacteria bacterium]